MLRDVIVGEADPANVILLEIEPEKQKTRIDFAATEKLIGVSEICISDVIKHGKVLFYRKISIEIRIERIYTRVIFDELSRTEKNFNFDLQEELNVTWVPHPNWFYKISKYSLPVLKGEFVPKCFYLRDLTSYPNDLENYVLKPLFSFAGLGVKIDVTKKILDEIKEPENYIIQEKVEYAPLIETPDDFAKVEIRMMEKSRKAMSVGDVDNSLLPCGQVVGLINDVPTMKELIDNIIKGAIAVDAKVGRIIHRKS